MILGQRRRRLILALLACLLTLSPARFPACAGTLESPLRFSVHFGLDGYYRTGEWMVVNVLAENHGAPVSVTLQVIQDPQPGVSRVVALPARSRKRVRLYVPLRGLDWLRSVYYPDGDPKVGLEVWAGSQLLMKTDQPYKPGDRMEYAVALVDEARLAPGFLRDSVLSPAGDPATLQPESSYTSDSPYSPRSSLSQPGTLAPVILHLPSAHFPELAAALRPLDCIVMRPSTLRKLTEPQRASLQAWVELGGALLLFAGHDSDLSHLSVAALCPARSGPLRSLARLRLPEPPGPAADSSHSDNDFFEVPGPILVRAVQRRMPGMNSGIEPPRVLWSCNSCDLLMIQRRGFGGVAYCAVDLLEPVLMEWNSRDGLWIKLLSTMLGQFQTKRVNDVQLRPLLSQLVTANLSEDPGVAMYLRRLYGVNPPPRWALAVVAVIYVFVFGPINIILVRRVKRSERGWLMTPFLSLVFTGFLLAAGIYWSGGQSLLQQISFLECRSGSAHAHEEIVFSLFAPIHRRFTIRAPDPGFFLEDKTAEEEATADMDRQSYPRGLTFNMSMSRRTRTEIDDFPPAATAREIVQDDQASEWVSIPMQVWSLRRMRTSREAYLGGPVVVHAAPGLGGWIRNGTSVRLRNCNLVSGRFRCVVGALLPGEVRQIPSATWQEAPSFGPPTVSPLSPFRSLMATMPITLNVSGEVMLMAELDHGMLPVDAGPGVEHRRHGILIVRHAVGGPLPLATPPSMIAPQPVRMRAVD